VLKLSSALRLEIEMLMNEKGKVVAELTDKKWLLDLALLCDISNHLNDLIPNFRGQQKLISGMFGTVRSF
jgi:hypothetical protein